MQYKFIYKDKKTGKKIRTNKKLEDNNLELIMEVKGGPINKNKVLMK